jgi:signal transduction histidine kinase/DNA-binding response OmpR family regulator
VLEEDRVRVVEEWRRAAAERRPFDLEHRLFRDGELRWVRLRAELLHDADGRVVSGVGTAQDITQQKQYELEIERHRRHLQELVDERTAELVTARDAAESANRTKSAFVANMSHEIRTPMNAIIGLTHVLRRSATAPKQVEQLDKVADAANHLLGLINDILDLSKIEAGKVEVTLEDFTLERSFVNVVNLVVDKAAAKGLDVVVELDPALPACLRGDPTKLGQILLNYASNAVKFTDSGTVRLVARRSGAEPAMLRLEVHDTGPGLSPAQVGRLFQPFEQGDASTTRRHGGTGLGLAISKRLASVLGGTVGVVSRPGEGSLFWCELPLLAAVRAPEPEAAPRSPPQRILVAERAPAARRVLQALLTAEGHVVDGVDSARGAIARVAEADDSAAPYTLVFLDRATPEPDGIETARLLARLSLRHPLPRIVLTALGLPISSDELAAAGADAGLARPVVPSAIPKLIAEVLRVGPLPRRAAPPAPGEPRFARHRGARVLVVEDNEINQEVALELLHSVGLATDTAADGVEAVERVRTQDYALVLMDVQMPRMDGLAATRAIRALPGREALPVLAMTADAFDDDRRQCLEAGMNDLVSKPVDPHALFAQLLRWLPPTGEAAEPAAPAEGRRRRREPATAGDVALRQALSAIPGVDVGAGLHVLGDRLSTYASLLARFVAGHGEDGERIRELVEVGDAAEARRVVHSLKGVSATLGLQTVRQHCTTLQEGWRDERSVSLVRTEVAALSSELTRLTAALRAVLPTGTAPGEGPVTDAQVREAARRLLGLLDQDDIGSTELLREVEPVLAARLTDAQLAQLWRQLVNFDFPAAAETLRGGLGALLDD